MGAPGTTHLVSGTLRGTWTSSPLLALLRVPAAMNLLLLRDLFFFFNLLR